MKKKILITGGCGFIGKNISNELVNLANTEIVIIDDCSSGDPKFLSKKIKIYKKKINLKNLEKITKKYKINYIIHCAANFANQNSIDKPYLDLQTNINGTLNVLNVAKKFNVLKVINLSSSCIYENFNSSEDNFEPSHDTPYAISKFAAEQYMSFFKKYYDMNIINLRLFNIYGPYDYYGKYRNVVPNWIHLAINNKNLLVHGDGRDTRDFTFVLDLVDAIKLILFKKNINGTFNFGASKETRVKILAKKIINFTRSKGKATHIKVRSWDKKPKRLCNNKKFLKTFKNFKFTKIDDGLKYTIAWFLKNRN